jgi:hypothetical protein
LGAEDRISSAQWCGYKGIIRVVVHCFRVYCNGRLFSCGCLRQLAAHRKSRVGTSWSVWDVGVYRDARKTFSFFRRFARATSGTLLFGWPFPPFWRWLSSTLSCFFFCFFFLDTSGLVFFSRATFSAKMSFPSSLSGLLLWFSKRCWIFYAMLVCYTLLCYNLYIKIRCALVHCRFQVSDSPFSSRLSKWLCRSWGHCMMSDFSDLDFHLP